jgi:membrane protease YdiL (CAAX protease family)
MRKIPITLTLIALLVRLVIINVWKIPQIVYVPIELCLIGVALYFERDRLRTFFIRTDRIKADLVLGVILGILNALVEATQYRISHGEFLPYRLDTILIVPVGILVAGWRAGVYEELLFRSLSMGYLKMWSRNGLFAIVGQGLLFWVAHVRYLNPESTWGIFTLIFGLLLGALTYWRGSVIPAMIIHAIANSYGASVFPPGEYLEKALRSWL